MEKVIPYETRVLRSMACLRALRWPLDTQDVRRFPESIQGHGGVVCREAARRLAVVADVFRRSVERAESRRGQQTAALRRERTIQRMFARYGRVQGRRRAA